MALMSIATRWKVLSGEGNWEDLLYPLDIDLRRYIIHYGERAQAVGDAFIGESKSDNYGLCRFAKRNFFSNVGLEKGNPFNYEVKKYFYGSAAFIADTCKSEKALPVSPNAVAGNSKWLGFVAVATDQGKEVLGRRDILVSIRGTIAEIEKCIDLKVGLVSASEILGNDNHPKVHEGWYLYYTSSEPGSTYNPTSCRDQILTAVRELVDQYKDEEVSITFTGHSMGAALAILAATDIVYNSYHKPSDEPKKAFPVTAIVLASPRLGNKGFATTFSALENLHVLRVRNKKDLVPDLPLPIGTQFDYVHVGQHLVIDTLESPYLKDAWKTVHQLEVYLHGIAETQGGAAQKFSRDIKLVNKDSDGLKDECLVVSKWWTEKNKGMVQLDDGSWVLKDREVDDDEEKPKSGAKA